MKILMCTSRPLSVAVGSAVVARLATTPALAAAGDAGTDRSPAGLDAAAPVFPKTFAALKVQRRCRLSTDIRADGRYVAFDAVDPLGDTNTSCDVYLWDVLTSSVTLVSVGPEGEGGSSRSSGPTISDDGRFVAFQSTADDHVAGDTNGVSDVFAGDLHSRVTTKVSTPPGGGDADGASGEPTWPPRAAASPSSPWPRTS